MVRTLFSLFSLSLAALGALPEIKPCGRVDVGPVYVQVQVLEDGSKMQEINLFGGRVDASILPFKDSGFAIKPTATASRGDGEFYTYGVGLGYYIPFFKCCYFVPVAGLGWTNLSTTVDLTFPTGLQPPFPGEVLVRDIDERFRSDSRYLGFELMCQFRESIYTTFIYQYAWADGDTRLRDDFFPGGEVVSKGKTSGANFAVSIDYYFTKCFSTSIAAGVNNSLDENRFGIRAYGVKLSVGYYFGGS